jgi:anti-sigma regulatory factor (Ser/Thr protein kinase)
MPTDLEVSFPATTSGMVAALETIEHSGAAWNLGADLIGRLRIIVEELFSNTIKYGYGRECDHPVRLRLSPTPVPTLTYEDDADPFDPTRWKLEDDDVTPDERPEGRAGIKMVLGLSATAIYLPRNGGNCLVLTLGAREG